jgi:hypothetical protein
MAPLPALAGLRYPRNVATREQVRAFLDRPWHRLRRAKDRYLAARVAEMGADEAFRMAAELNAHARAMGAQWSAADREADLDAAVTLRRILDRAGQRSRRTR